MTCHGLLDKSIHFSIHPFLQKKGPALCYVKLPFCSYAPLNLSCPGLSTNYIHTMQEHNNANLFDSLSFIIYARKKHTRKSCQQYWLARRKSLKIFFFQNTIREH